MGPTTTMRSKTLLCPTTTMRNRGGLHDPDIAVLYHTVPTAPSTSDVPLALQCLSSVRFYR
eukprot:7351730-Pyramimonas_sp.AAC.1